MESGTGSCSWQKLDSIVEAPVQIIVSKQMHAYQQTVELEAVSAAMS